MLLPSDRRKVCLHLSARRLTLAFVACAASLHAQSQSIFGNWKEPKGAIIRIERCPSGVCLQIASLSPSTPGTKDVHNPDPAQRSRSLCNLEIGSSFQLSDAAHAFGGTLYDPESGKTYRGTITLEGDTLHLRGYVGLPIFGRTETWHRATGSIAACRAALHP